MASAPRPVFFAILLFVSNDSGFSAVPAATNDLWDVAAGVTITADSGMRGGFNPASIFGGNGSIETGQAVFADDRPPGFTHFVEWQTTTPIDLNRIHLFASGDEAIYNYQREFSSFTLKAKRNAADPFTTVHTFTPSHPYTFLDTESLAILATEVEPISAQYFRAEFVQHTSGTPFDGPRVVELDGFGTELQAQIPQSTNDLWDVSQGTTIIASSGVWPGFHETDAIGTSFSTEVGQTVFADGKTNGSTHFIEWKTSTAILLTNFNIFAAGDGAIYNHEREFAQFTLKTRVSESDAFQTIYTYTAEHPYEVLDPISHAIISATISPTEAQFFRAEFVQWNAGRGYDGPRVIEMDGFGTVLQPKITTSTNDLWDTSRGATITASSGFRSGFAGSDAFGTFLSVESGSAIFADGKPAGYSHFIEWQSASPIRLTGFNLFAAGDPPIYHYEREFEHFTLKAKRHLGDEFSTIYTFTPSHPYTYLDVQSAAILSAAIPQVDAQYFRAEFVQRNVGRGFDAPRVVELDAIATILPQGQGTIADWTFEEGVPGHLATNIIDHSGNNHHGVPVGSPQFATGSGTDAGQIALQLTGGSHFRPGSSGSFKFLTNDFTLEAIFLPASMSANTNQTIIAAQNPQDGGLAYLLSYHANPSMATFSLITSNGFIQYVSVPLPRDGTPHHIAALRKGRTLAIYLDHQLAQSKDVFIFPNFPIEGSVDLRVGATSFGSWLEGSLDRVRISQGALTQSEFIQFTAPALRIVEQPKSQFAVTGSDVTFSVGVESTSVPTFLWSFNGSDIVGATNSVLVLSNVQPTMSGAYSVSVSASGKTVMSEAAHLSVGNQSSNGPAQTDLFDVSKGTRVVRHSGMFPSIAPAAMFGDASPSVETDSTIFRDGRTNGFTHFIEWRTAAPVILRSFKLFAAGDPPIYLYEREFSSFTLLAKSSPFSTNYDRVVFDYTASHPYTYANPTNLLLIDAILNDPVTAQEFRAEFVQWNAGRGYDGPRIIELDGFGDALNVPSPTVADWTFENGSPGQQILFVPDVSGAGHDITQIIGNDSVFVATEDSTAGAVSVSLSGGQGAFGSALRVSDSLDFNLANHFTIEISVAPGAANSILNRAVVAGQDAATGRLVYALDYLSEQRALNFVIIDSQGRAELVTTIIPNDGIPHHIAGVYSAGALKIYLDKTLVDSKSTSLIPGVFPGGAVRMTIGAIDNSSYSFQGILDRVRISREALSPDRFFQHRRDTNAPLTILQPLQDITVDQGSVATFQVTATGPSAISYLWRHNDAIIPHQTNSTLTLQNVQPTDAGTYKVSLASGPWEATSTAVLTINQPTNSAPTILTQPLSRHIPIGQDVQFSVVAAGSPPLTYQWKWDGLPLIGKTSSTLTLNDVSMLHTGQYTVEVRNDLGFTNSIPALLTVFAPDTNAPVVVITSPIEGTTQTNRINFAGTISGTITRAEWFRNRQLVGSLQLTDGEFSIPNILLATGTNTFLVRAYNEVGGVGTASVTVILETNRAIWIGSSASVQEGARVNLPIYISSSGEIGALSFSVLYDTNYLTAPELSFLNQEVGAFTQVNLDSPGVIRATYVLPGRTLPAGNNTTFATVRFRTRSVPLSMTTPVQLELLGLYSDAGDPIASGTSVGSGEVPIVQRKYVGDNNANDRLDIADATAIIRMITLLDPIRSWDVTGNDLNSNSSLDAGDIVRVLRAVVNLDPQPSGQNAPQLAAASASNAKISLSSSSARLTPGGQIKILVSLAELGQPLSGASFRLNYPAGALRLESSSAHSAGSLVPQNSLTMWHLLPDQDYAQQSGTIHFAASSATAWAASSGAIAELNFTVLPAAASQYAWPLRVSQAEAAAGLDPVSLGTAEILLTGRDAQPAQLAEVTFDLEADAIQLRLIGEAGVRYQVMSSTNLVDWTEVGVYSDASGAVLISDPVDPDAAQKFYRATQLD